jgi:hypothetical protein
MTSIPQYVEDDDLINMAIHQMWLAMSDERRAQLSAALDFSADFPDGAWNAYIFHECGFDVYELVAFDYHNPDHET